MRPQRGRQKLLDAAMVLFERQGYFATTVEQITKQAGVSKGLVYNYFKSKEELLVALIEHGTEKMAQVSGTSEDVFVCIEERLAHFIDRYVDFLQGERLFLKLQLTLLLSPELKDIVFVPQQRRAAMLFDTVSQWFRQFGHPEPENKARMFLALLDGVALHYLCIFEHYPLLEMKATLLLSAQEICRAGAGD